MAKKIILKELEMYLLPQRALYIPRYLMLVVSDWHIGKLTHFRKEGLFVPPSQTGEELQVLGALLEKLNVKTLLFLGDLFHSDYNSDWEIFAQYMQHFPGLEIVLTKGNHDILNEERYERLGIRITDRHILPEGIVFSHDSLSALPDDVLNISGHIHPGCLLEAKGRQYFRLPCFYLKDQSFILPAFGKWTGLHIVPRTARSCVYAIIDRSVVEV